EIREKQLVKLQALVHNAYQNSPFYRQRFKTIGLVPGDVKSLEDLRVIPPLEKGELQAQRDALVSAKYCKEQLAVNQTGGSTGTPISFFVPRDRLRSRAAATLRHNSWAG